MKVVILFALISLISFVEHVGSDHLHEDVTDNILSSSTSVRKSNVVNIEDSHDLERFRERASYDNSVNVSLLLQKLREVDNEITATIIDHKLLKRVKRYGGHHHRGHHRRHHHRRSKEKRHKPPKRHGSKEKTPRHHEGSREKRRGGKSRERTAGGSDWPTSTNWNGQFGPNGNGPRHRSGYNPHVPLFMPQGGSGIPSFVPHNSAQQPQHGLVFPGYFPRNPYYPSYIPGSPSYHPQPIPSPYYPNLIPDTPNPTTLSTIKPSISPPTTFRPIPFTPGLPTTTSRPNSVTETTYVSMDYTGSTEFVTLGVTYPNGQPVTPNTDAETIPPFVRIGRGGETARFVLMS